MKWTLIYTEKARKDLAKLPKRLQIRIANKLDWFAEQEDTLNFAEPLYNSLPATHRIRIGDYRAKVAIRFTPIGEIIIYRIQHRKEVYR